jgi:hypothetical protein
LIFKGLPLLTISWPGGAVKWRQAPARIFKSEASERQDASDLKLLAETGSAAVLLSVRIAW